MCHGSARDVVLLTYSFEAREDTLKLGRPIACKQVGICWLCMLMVSPAGVKQSRLKILSMPNVPLRSLP